MQRIKAISWLPLLSSLLALPAWAQSNIVPDDTLGPNSSEVFDLPSFQQEQIYGGLDRGKNLFHSFEAFNVAENWTTFFITESRAVENILARVTGSQASEILGTLSTFGRFDGEFENVEVNLFLLNPKGIIFGPNARLNVNGSFVASTADGFVFEDLGTYSARSPEAPSPLLTISPSAFQFGALPPGGIVARSVAQNTEGETVGLDVPKGESLVLLGGNVAVDGGRLTAEEGRIEIGSATGAGTVELDPDGSLIFSPEIESGDVRFEDGAVVNVQFANRGDISVTAQNIDVIDSQLRAGIAGADSTAESQAGDVFLDAVGQISIQGNSFIGNDVASSANGGSAGDVDIATSALNLTDGARISASTFGKGNAGRVFILADSDIKLTDNALIASQIGPNATGDSGGVFIETEGNFSLNGGAKISTTAFGEGDAGLILVEAEGLVSLQDRGSSIASQIGRNAIGESGAILIDADQLSISNGASVSTSIFGDASEDIGGVVGITIQGQVIVQGSGSFIASQIGIDGSGEGGAIFIDAGSLSVLDGGKVSTATSGEGNAGFVIVNSGEVTVDGEGSAITGTVNAGARGDGGEVSIEAGNLLILEGGQVSTATSGEGDAGLVDVVISGGEVKVEGTDSAITSTVESGASGEGGEVSIEASRLSVLNGGEISTETSGQGNPGLVDVLVEGGAVIVKGRGSLISSRVRSNAKSDSEAPFLFDESGVFIQAGSLLVSQGGDISTSTFGQGNAGKVMVNVQEGEVTVDGDGSFIASQVGEDAQGDSGGISITAGSLVIRRGGTVSASISGQGKAGQVDVGVTGDVTIEGDGSFLASQVNSAANGSSDGLSISAAKLSVLNGARVTSLTFGNGNAGPLEIEAREIELSTSDSIISAQTTRSGIGGDIRLSSPDDALTIIGPGKVSVETRRTGQAGSVDITSQQLRLTDGVTLSASTEGSAAGGNIILSATNILEIDNSRITSSTGEDSAGVGGNITVDAPTINVLNGGAIEVNSNGSGQGGEVSVIGDRLTLDDSLITADTLSSDGGNLRFDLQEALLLRGGSEISTTAGTDDAGGNGGNIAINTPFIFAPPNENSDIIANAFAGSGGEIRIRAEAILGLQQNNNPDTEALRDNKTNDISASSQFGSSGLLSLAGLNIDPSQGVNELPSIPPDSADQISRRCSADRIASDRDSDETGSAFYITGNGGLPSKPGDANTSSYITEAIQTVPDANTIATATTSGSPDLRAQATVTLREATTWQRNTKGQVQLVGNAAPSPSADSSCQAS